MPATKEQIRQITAENNNISAADVYSLLPKNILFH